MGHLKTIEDEISTWASVSVHPHRFGGREFRFGNTEIGHVHTGGTVDVRFMMSSWRKVSLKSTTGFPTQVGSLFISAVGMTSGMRCGCCGFPIAFECAALRTCRVIA